MSFDIPKQDVAGRLVVNTNPTVEVDGVPLGLEFWKVLVQEANKPNANLERLPNGIYKV